MQRRGRKDLESAEGSNLAPYFKDNMSSFQHLSSVFHTDFGISI